jgi:hypothetical protein
MTLQLAFGGLTTPSPLWHFIKHSRRSGEHRRGNGRMGELCPGRRRRARARVSSPPAATARRQSSPVAADAG